MRLFVVINEPISEQPRLKASGLQCQRESIHLKGFYNEKIVHFMERRYSTALNLFPLQHPFGSSRSPTLYRMTSGTRCGMGLLEMVLVFIIVRFPGKNMEFFQPAFAPGSQSFSYKYVNSLRERLSRYPGAARTESVSSPNTFNALKYKTDAAESFFKFYNGKVAHPDGNKFVNLRNCLIPVCLPRTQIVLDDWFEDTYPNMKETKRIVDYNWETVRKHQKESAERILTKLERTRNEVKSLMDGLFNFQSILAAQESIDEAQKSRELNKYMLVFTVVTIAFLPPTFVATFFSNSLFSSPSSNDSLTNTRTRTKFWITFAVLTITTYIIAALMLLMTNKQQKSWVRVGKGILDRVRSSAGDTSRKLKKIRVTSKKNKQPMSPESKIERGQESS
ncbi:hypothetical protein F5884DRAFT_880853 [Xylogone sp. PMI_703]|nr:hypothetical protein F5884DRAFT_880853 [Xylogone sp. PMI_703]